MVEGMHLFDLDVIHHNRCRTRLLRAARNTIRDVTTLVPKVRKEAGRDEKSDDERDLQLDLAYTPYHQSGKIHGFG